MRIYRTYDYEMIAKLNKPVHDIHSKFYPEYYKEYSENAAKEFFKKIINIESFIFLILEDRNQTLGYVWIEIRNYPEIAFNKGYKAVYVQQISIIESQRNKGYGAKLMEEVYNIAKSMNIGIIELDYWVENQDAKDFYKKLGFIKSREFVYKQI
ncbi:GNAT family N-acetyltransferase [Domibacillus epiphyticus]|uniref:GNAT family N-acetyltransferase n=1 Tax=Domibacillus epiphyticus TaxID=1714355 RepID=A0A1V2A5Z3_9BACI|nr:GNAT family N-acetyltransferase [Domibacillus epiphyticus]OMP66350.1 GNAT family N-acetyltransferase [Domibacillus epiphyticus]